MKEESKEARITKREAGVILTLMGLLFLIFGTWISWGLRGGIPLGEKAQWTEFSAKQFGNFLSMFWIPGLLGSTFLVLGIVSWRSSHKKNLTNRQSPCASHEAHIER